MVRAAAFQLCVFSNPPPHPAAGRLVPGSPGGGATPPPGVEVKLGMTLEPSKGDPRVGDGSGFQPWSSIVRELRQRGWSADLLDTHPYDWR